MNIYFGIVENRNDPLELGRCQVRVVGLHTHDKNLLPTSDLPWAAAMQPTTSAAMNGIGYTPVGPVEGTSVVVTYLDDNMQQGLILGAVGGIATEPVPIDFDDSGPILSTTEVKQIFLRTIAGPVSGNKLTFYDPNANRTDLTNKLTANMRVSGYGIDEGTTIVSIDSGTEITISTTVRDFGENILEFKPPASNSSAIVESKTVVTASTLIDKADTVKNTPVNSTIPTIPPPQFKQIQSKAAEGIKALIAACDKVGLTTKEQKCALLAIAGGESKWQPVEELYSYSSPTAIKQLFSFLTDEEAEKYSNAPKKGITRAEFFSVIYGTTKRGKGFNGNKTDADGGMYYGRGFIQITGRGNYEKYSKQLKKYGVEADIVSNPNLLISDINVSALVSALYLKDRVPKAVNPNASPDYFNEAKAAVGINIPRVAAEKLSFYQYFYGTTDTSGVVKDAAPEIPGVPVITGSDQPGPSDKAISSGSFGIGFRDPNNKYPLKEYLNESDVNRLARGVIDGTVVGIKDSKRKVGIPKSFGGTWDQPISPFGAKYPYNKVFESESGHIQEWDDTPGQERISTYHRSGTFTEVDSNGTQVNYIVGDNFILMENNGCIHVAGECNITVDGNVNLNARSDANIQVAANAKIEVGNNADIGVANDVTMAVGGNMETHVSGQYKLTAEAGMEFVTGGSIAVQSTQALSLKNGGLYNESTGPVAIKTNGAFALQAGGDVGLKAGKKLFATASGGSLNIRASGPVKLDGSTFLQQSNAAGYAANVEGVASIDGSALPAPAAGEPLYATPPYFIPPERQFESVNHIETPEDWDTPEGRAVLAEASKTEGASSIALAGLAEGTDTISGGRKTTTTVDTSLILTTKDFTNDYRLSKNFSLGMLIDGGVNGKHKLVSQMLKSSKTAPERLYTVQEIVSNLAETAHNVLEPALEVLPGGISGYNRLWKINSGYRLKGVTPNESPTSDHCKGHCVDIGIIDPDKYNKTFEIIKLLEAKVSYDQIILEYNKPSSCWIHIGYRKNNNRKMAFTMLRHEVYKRDSNGIPRGFYLLSSF